MRLYHYTDEPPGEVAPADQSRSDGRKPCGFWVSDCDTGDGWREWCEAESFGLGRLRYRQFVDVDEGKILHLKSVSDIDSFSVDFQRNEIFGSYTKHLIDWVIVAQEFSGILISPYQWGRRLDGSASDWYYGWDCASGCIWNPDAITGLTFDKSHRRKAA